MILLWALTALLTQQPAASPTVVLDFEFFRAQVQPIFLEKRPGYTRCVVCHADPSRFAHWSQDERKDPGDRHSRPGHPGPLLCR